MKGMPEHDDEGSTTWVGEWRNQYGSTLTIADDADGRLQGTFRTALGDSGFAGEDAEITGIHRGECVQIRVQPFRANR